MNNLTLIEGGVVCVVVVSGTVAAILGHLDPALAGLLGVAVGYGGGRTVSSISTKSNG